MPDRIDRRIRAFQTSPESVSDSHFIVDYRFSPETGFSLEESTFRTLLITSQRTIKPLRYEPGSDRELVDGSIDDVGAYIPIQQGPSGSGLVTIALPLHLCSKTESLTGLIQLIGSGAEYSYTKEYWIERLTLPTDFVLRFKGPRFGIEGIRSKFNVHSRPLVGLILKPRRGVPLSTIKAVASEALEGGADFICDDLLMTDPDGELSFSNRVPIFADLARLITDRTGEKKSYICNVAATPFRSARYIESAIAVGVDAVMLNGFSMGIGAIADLVDLMPEQARLPVISTNMGVALMARAPTQDHTTLTQTGISEAIIAKLCRLGGADAVHTGTVDSECYGEMEWSDAQKAVQERMGSIRRCFAVAEGDLQLANLWENIASLGPDVLIEATSGIVNYPGGARKGAAMFRRFVDELDGINMDDRSAYTHIRAMARRDANLRQVLTREGFEIDEHGNRT
ncbi:RuBisCO large subunit C-terminal-like domain-containing protein [Frankia sp. Mgl5]|uniref:RuBisCO large subunit C-terminal-like domain-containing protein n=1 Tax=Frankia sp. Mgl5 TaxID=2933793 RepID=UPI00200FFB46|nr:RuBisCO large subunit C-terminal-like domain-containing protein [Frankia sp. Mgl5]MCK9932545.1 RuBisCO large subunit C-terminal-like domain-containing protein [Frankia sp. Mgl5]